MAVTGAVAGAEQGAPPAVGQGRGWPWRDARAKPDFSSVLACIHAFQVTHISPFFAILPALLFRQTLINTQDHYILNR